MRTPPEAEPTEALEDQLFAVRELKGEQAFPRDAKAYLSDWAREGRAPWLQGVRLHYRGDIDTHGFAILEQELVGFGFPERVLRQLA